MSGDVDLLTIAASYIEEYCNQIKDCKDCKIKSICDTLDQELGASAAVHERIRRAAEG